MEKTKIGLSVALVSAFVYLVALFGGYAPLILVGGYILIAEESSQLKKAAVTAMAVLLAVSAAVFLVGLIPDLLNTVYTFLRLFDVQLYDSTIQTLANLLSNIIYIARSVALVGLAGLSLINKPMNLPFIDRLFD